MSASPSTVARPAASTLDQLEALRPRLAGELLTADSVGYDDARQTIFVQVDRRPLAIVRAAGTADVAVAVAFAAERGLPLAVRSGGHSVAHHGVVDDALVVDLSGMNRVDIDPEARIARLQAGATTGDLAGPAGEHGLALSTGDTASVAMGGLTTGGGIGFLVRKYGLAIDNLLSAEVVTADGAVLTASAYEHPDLFWAIRGGGGNVGVVTEFTYRLAPVGTVLGGALILPASRAVLRGYLDHAASAPEGLTTIANLMRCPPMPFVAPERIGEEVLAILVCWTGDPAEGERALAPLRALATPVADVVAPMPYPAIYQLTGHQTARHATSIRSMFADDLSDAALDAMLAALRNATSPFCLVQLRGLGGAMARIAPDATAFAHRERRYFLAILGMWMDPAEDGAPHVAWTDALWRAVRHEGRGVYVNFLEEEGAERVHDAYPPATYARLAEIKRRYDPTNLFRFNHNVPPRG